MCYACSQYKSTHYLAYDTLAVLSEIIEQLKLRFMSKLSFKKFLIQVGTMVYWSYQQLKRIVL